MAHGELLAQAENVEAAFNTSLFQPGAMLPDSFAMTQCPLLSAVRLKEILNNGRTSYVVTPPGLSAC